jgi:uncharacterized protein YqfA (UPF0365 family)
MIQLLTSHDFQIGVLTGVLGVIGIYSLLLLLGVVLRPWLYAKASGVDVMVRQLIGMRLRRVDPRLVIAAYVRDPKRGGHHSLDVIEATYLASVRLFDASLRGRRRPLTMRFLPKLLLPDR